jgi:ABC-type transporter Mla subunit MlaD
MTVLLVCTHSAVAGDDHIVPLTDLQQQLRTAAQQRAADQTDLARVLALPAAKAEFAKYDINPTQVQTAIATLSDAELARLASRARSAEKDVEGGLIVGLLALIGLIVVVIIIVSVVTQAVPPSSPSGDVYASADHGGVKRGTPVPQVAPVHG